MAIYLKNLKTGKLTNAAASILGASTTQATVIKNIILTNNNTVTETVNIYCRTSTAALTPVATNYLICPLSMKIPPGAQVILDAEVTLANNFNTLGPVVGDDIWGYSTNANQVDYVINGMVRDL